MLERDNTWCLRNQRIVPYLTGLNHQNGIHPYVLLHCTSSRTHSKREKNPQKNQSHQPAYAAHPLYRCKEFKRKSVPERYEVVKSFKMCFNCLKQGHQVNECSRLIVKLLTVRDIITVCYTMNVHLSNCLARTHKLSPHGLQTAPSRTWQPPTPSPPMTEWFISKLFQSRYEVKTGWR